MAMPPKGSEHISPPSGGSSHRLISDGVMWAFATVDAQGSSGSFSCPLPKDAWSFVARVHVNVETARKIACTVYANGSNVPSAANRVVLECALGGAEQKLALVDAGGWPWAELVISDALRLFDLKGRERAQLSCDWTLSGRKLKLQCWDEAGHEMAAQEFLMV